jgi:YCII-related domain
MKFLCYRLGDPNAPMAPPTPELYQQMDEFMAEATKAGVLLATGGVTPLSDAIKVRYSDGEFTVLDGPFAEAKELVGGWAGRRGDHDPAGHRRVTSAAGTGGGSGPRAVPSSIGPAWTGPSCSAGAPVV